MRYEVGIGDRRVRVAADPDGRLQVDGRVVAYDARELGDDVWSIVLEGAAHEVVLLGDRLRIDGIEVTIAVADERQAAVGAGAAVTRGGRHELRAPMAGLLKAVHVAEGDIVGPSDAVATLEAMKMENELRAPTRSRVRSLEVAAGTKVDGGTLIAVLVDEPA